MDFDWRALTRADIVAWNQLLGAAETVDKTGEHYNEADLSEELDDSATGPDDRVAAWVGNQMVAFAGTRPRPTVTDHWRIDGEGTVDPAYRGHGLGSHGVAWAVERATTLSRQRNIEVETRLQFTGFLDNADQVALLEGAGLVAVNWSATMRARLDRGEETPPHDERWPTGHHVRTYDRSRSAQTMAAHNDAFTDHWGFVPWTPQMWEQWVDGTKNARHDLSWVLVADAAPDRVVAYLLTSEFDAYEQVTGRREAYLARIGVRREMRRQGVASTLIHHALQSYRDDGFHETSLDVDTGDPTGAYGLYERAGYEVEKRTATFQLVLGRP